ncbi:putative 6-phosphofructo-2-kinase, Fructose-2,6-bisphosphate 2-phosphatase [Helianthus annuus]|nr:putative 6-phosphofructo-2-kinase, Fructose-2,6-bisphosphate 2-phosphatase [Helianthus annuus]KAJ0590314.1 putative 6-phosphofructo-2-kinase, Fructose-2,6-bisphosphate 2-phosphatase [Helianthus annuus]KAJ0598124.1 putative 6-phosphofructo-2-kinase, Fructose-2,6-bisphosphate 2-phosphatase [Helianthus annuus]KAJ0928241.1 putative 6-phosphofructo-2-kinase, Fructose-2,6-bisphosphate 2-phosphatase [Helianthus annuus]
MMYEEIKKDMPEEYELEPVIIKLERQRAPVIVVFHEAVLRASYAYFAHRPLKEIPHIEIRLHTIIEIQIGAT